MTARAACRPASSPPTKAHGGNARFVGDAQLPLLPKGAFKFVTFALDTKTDIRREDQGVVRTKSAKRSTAR